MTRSTGLVVSGAGIIAMLICTYANLAMGNQTMTLTSAVLAGLNGAMFLLWLIKERD